MLFICLSFWKCGNVCSKRVFSFFNIDETMPKGRSRVVIRESFSLLVASLVDQFVVFDYFDTCCKIVVFRRRCELYKIWKGSKGAPRTTRVVLGRVSLSLEVASGGLKGRTPRQVIDRIIDQKHVYTRSLNGEPFLIKIYKKTMKRIIKNIINTKTLIFIPKRCRNRTKNDVRNH